HGTCHVAGRDLQRRDHRRAGVRLSRPGPAADRGGLCRRLQPGAGGDGGLDHRGGRGGVSDRHPLPADRPADAADMTFLTVLRDLLRYNLRFAAGAVVMLVIVGLAGLSFVSPYSPLDTYVVPLDMPPSWAYPFGTTSRGQDGFWLLTFAMRNTLLFGIAVA